MEGQLCRQAPEPAAPRPHLQKSVVPLAPNCFLLHSDAGTSIGELSAYIRRIAKTYHAYGAANITFIRVNERLLNAF